ncbi:MAG: F0F1 ATP synthase subunit B' [Alphaproteobacteria bacterium]|nr:F0F1 ATP synthase subunit B' [Alphaproteobacteria bacterium]
MPQLDPTSFASQLFWLVVTFTFLYVVMARVIVPRIAGILEDRKGRLAEDLDKAEASRSSAEDARLDYEAALVKARNDAGALIAKATAAMAEDATEQHSKLDESLSKQMANAEKQLRATRKEALDKMVPVAVESARLVVEKLIGHAPDASKAEALVNRLAGER